MGTNNSHMLNIKRTTKRWQSIKVFNRRAQVVITRMRIGHSHLTHSYHLEPHRCDTTLTIPHILYDCGLFDAARANYGIGWSGCFLKGIFGGWLVFKLFIMIQNGQNNV
jgi:hypothetical protein